MYAATPPATIAPYVPVREASVCHLAHDAPCWAPVARTWEEVKPPVKPVETVEKRFQTELMFWYCEKAPYANMERESPL
jgi:hypothetical protein